MVDVLAIVDRSTIVYYCGVVLNPEQRYVGLSCINRHSIPITNQKYSVTHLHQGSPFPCSVFLNPIFAPFRESLHCPPSIPQSPFEAMWTLLDIASGAVADISCSSSLRRSFMVSVSPFALQRAYAVSPPPRTRSFRDAQIFLSDSRAPHLLLRSWMEARMSRASVNRALACFRYGGS